jgi:hypothetical protein
MSDFNLDDVIRDVRQLGSFLVLRTADRDDLLKLFTELLSRYEDERLERFAAHSVFSEDDSTTTWVINDLNVTTSKVWVEKVVVRFAGSEMEDVITTPAFFIHRSIAQQVVDALNSQPAFGQRPVQVLSP